MARPRREPGEMTERARVALRRFDETSTGHAGFVREVERRYLSYRGIIEEAAGQRVLDWTTKTTPPYAMHIIETAITALIDDKVKFRVRPRPKFYTAEEWALVRDGAKAHEWLLQWQLQQNRFHEKQRTWALQERLAGITCMKLRWRSDVRVRKRLELVPREITDEDGFPLGAFPMLTEVDVPETLYDGPDLEVVDMRDFFYDRSAVSWEKNEICVHRIMMTKEEAQLMASERLPAEVRWKGVDKLSGERDFAGEYEPKRMLTEEQRRRGRVEILEIWLKEDGKIRVYTIGNRSVLLNERDSPYFHGEFPFVVTSTQSDLFKIGGISQIEKIEGLQRMLWTISNLRQDATLLATMPIVLLQKDMDDPDQFDFRPFARNLVSQPQDVQLWSPPSQATQVSIPTEGLIKQDMQNITGGFPFTTTSEANTINADTATEASLVANLAQRSLVTAKTFMNYALERIGQQMTYLNQQYIRDSVYVNVLSIDDEYETKEIVPRMLRGDFDFVMEPVSDSLLRQEKRSEALSLFQTVLQAAPVFAMSGSPLNLVPFLEELLDAFDRKDLGRFLVTPPPMPMPMQGQGMGTPAKPEDALLQAMMGGGQTGPDAASNLSPSNATSMSAAAPMQRMGASGNGARNA